MHKEQIKIIEQELKDSKVLSVVKKLTNQAITLKSTTLNGNTIDDNVFLYFESDNLKSDVISTPNQWYVIFNLFVKRVFDEFVYRYFEERFGANGIQKTYKKGIFKNAEVNFDFKVDSLVDMSTFTVKVDFDTFIPNGSYGFDLDDYESYHIICTTNENEYFPRGYSVTNVTPKNFKKVLNLLQYDIVIIF